MLHFTDKHKVKFQGHLSLLDKTYPKENQGCTLPKKQRLFLEALEASRCLTNRQGEKEENRINKRTGGTVWFMVQYHRLLQKI